MPERKLTPSDAETIADGLQQIVDYLRETYGNDAPPAFGERERPVRMPDDETPRMF